MFRHGLATPACGRSLRAGVCGRLPDPVTSTVSTRKPLREEAIGMGRTKRHHKREQAERALPPMKKVPLAEFPPQVLGIMEPEWDVPLYRTPHAPTDSMFGPKMGRAYVEVNRRAQVECCHAPAMPDRFGESTCLDCGARMWSPWWVAWGLYGESDYGHGDGTRAWIISEERLWSTRSMQRFHTETGGQSC